jgi:hypothetical protein
METAVQVYMTESIDIKTASVQSVSRYGGYAPVELITSEELAARWQVPESWVRKHWAILRIATTQTVHLDTICQLLNHWNRRAALASLGGRHLPIPDRTGNLKLAIFIVFPL